MTVTVVDTKTHPNLAKRSVPLPVDKRSVAIYPESHAVAGQSQRPDCAKRDRPKVVVAAELSLPWGHTTLRRSLLSDSTHPISNCWGLVPTYTPLRCRTSLLLTLHQPPNTGPFLTTCNSARN